MNGKLLCFVDQYGDAVFASTVRELRQKRGGGRVSKMYRDKTDGRTVHTGYIVGHRWFSMFQPVEVAA